MYKDLAFSDDARSKILNGVKILSKAVKATLGPSGRQVLIARAFLDPVTTKDGVTVANSIELKDAFENAGAQLVRVVASKTATEAGDGTTTATLLAEAIYTEGLKAVLAGVPPLGIKRGIERGVKEACEYLKVLRTQVSSRKEIEQIGTIASNNDTEIGQLLADAMEKVGKDGVVTIEESPLPETTLDLSEGMQFDKGYITPYLHLSGNPYTFRIDWDSAYFLFYDGRIDNFEGWTNFLGKYAGQQVKQFVWVVNDMSDIALKTLAANNAKGITKMVAVKAPGFGQRKKDILEDLAILTGGKVADADTKMDQLHTYVGQAEKVKISKDSTTIISGAGKKEDIKNRIKQIREELEQTVSEFDREKLQERLAKLSGGVARIGVGGKTEPEMKEKKDRVEDALHATRAAVEEGILPGGGVALLRCYNHLKKIKVAEYEMLGFKILLEALRLPAWQIAENGGQKGDVVVDTILKNKQLNWGFNALTNTYEDLLKVGVIDPLKVTRCALQNAASVATLLLTTEVMIVEDPLEAQKLMEQNLQKQ